MPSGPGTTMALLAYEKAVRLFRMALAALSLARPPGEDRARCWLLLALGDALTRMGERRAAREELMRATAPRRQGAALKGEGCGDAGHPRARQ
jgi:hypothetical protein